MPLPVGQQGYEDLGDAGVWKGGGNPSIARGGGGGTFPGSFGFGSGGGLNAVGFAEGGTLDNLPLSVRRRLFPSFAQDSYEPGVLKSGVSAAPAGTPAGRFGNLDLSGLSRTPTMGLYQTSAPREPGPVAPGGGGGSAPNPYAPGGPGASKDPGLAELERQSQYWYDRIHSSPPGSKEYREAVFNWKDVESKKKTAGSAGTPYISPEETYRRIQTGQADVGDFNRWITQIIGGGGQGMFSPEGDPAITQALTQRATEQSLANQRSAGLSARLNAGDDPAMRAFAEASARSGSQESSNAAILDASINQRLQSQAFIRQLLAQIQASNLGLGNINAQGAWNERIANGQRPTTWETIGGIGGHLVGSALGGWLG